MKAMNSTQILVTILATCLLMVGIAFVGFWQFFHLRAEIRANQTNVTVQVETQ